MTDTANHAHTVHLRVGQNNMQCPNGVTEGHIPIVIHIKMINDRIVGPGQDSDAGLPMVPNAIADISLSCNKDQNADGLDADDKSKKGKPKHKGHSGEDDDDDDDHAKTKTGKSKRKGHSGEDDDDDDDHAKSGKSKRKSGSVAYDSSAESELNEDGTKVQRSKSHGRSDRKSKNSVGESDDESNQSNASSAGKAKAAGKKPGAKIGKSGGGGGKNGKKGNASAGGRKSGSGRLSHDTSGGSGGYTGSGKAGVKGGAKGGGAGGVKGGQPRRSTSDPSFNSNDRLSGVKKGDPSRADFRRDGDSNGSGHTQRMSLNDKCAVSTPNLKSHCPEYIVKRCGCVDVRDPVTGKCIETLHRRACAHHASRKGTCNATRQKQFLIGLKS